MTREEAHRVDKQVVKKSAELFVQDASDFICDNLKVVLLSDSYRSHVSFEAFLLDDGNVIAFEIPAHGSGTTQLFDVSVFGPL